jgi:hypothetical protein
MLPPRMSAFDVHKLHPHIFHQPPQPSTDEMHPYIDVSLFLKKGVLAAMII